MLLGFYIDIINYKDVFQFYYIMIQGVYLLLVVVLIVLGIMQRLGFLKGIYHIVLSGIALASVLVLRNVDFGVIDMIRYHIDYNDIKYVNNF